MRVNRIDRGEVVGLAPPVEMPNGWLRVDGRIARVGIQEYEDPGGGVHRELRLPEEVFEPGSLASFAMVPVTNTHPPVLLDAKNTRTFQVGAAGQEIRRDGDYVVAPLLITDSDTITCARAGRVQLSNGYTCELDSTQDAGLIEKWGPYDFIQRKIQGNHIALVDAARAGPEARIRLDSAGNAVLPIAAAPTPTAEPERTMPKNLRIDSITIDAEAADAQAVIDRTLAALKERSDAAIGSEKQRADAATKKLAVVKDNATRLIGHVGKIRLVWDGMKARMVACDECDGTGKVAGDADPSKMEKCGYCDGKGSVRMHDAIKGMKPADDAGESQEEIGEDELEEAVGEAEGTDADELEVEQETEGQAGKAAAKGDRAREKRRADAAREREDEQVRRRDSLVRRARRDMKARVALELNARRFLTEDELPAAELAKLDETGVMKAITLKLAPGAKLDGKSPEAIRARYEAEIERAPEFTLDDAREMSLRSLPAVGGGNGPTARRDNDPEKARAAMIQRKDEQAKRKTAAAK